MHATRIQALKPYLRGMAHYPSLATEIVHSPRRPAFSDAPWAACQER